MEKIKMEQGSDEWLEYRYDCRNASEAGTVMDVNPYQTPYELRVEKTTRHSAFEGNIATDYGHRWEDAARARVADLLDIELTPAIYREGVYSASLDAYGTKDNESVKVEIKCPFQRKRSKLWKQTQIDNAGWAQCVPDQYFWQIVHQDMVCPTSQTYFFVYIPEKGDEEEDFELVQCFPNEDHREILVAAWDKFYSEPPKPPTKTVKDAYLIGKLVDLKELKAGQTAIADQIKEIEDMLKVEAGENDIEFPDGTTIKWGSRVGSVDNKKIAEKYDINLDDFRKAPSRFQTIKIKG
jgi:putative phage-type endonuclease